MHAAPGKVLSGPGETRSDIWVVKPDTNEGQWEGTVRAQDPSTGPSRGSASWATRLAKQVLLVACTGAPRSCLSPAPGSSVNSPTFPGAPSINTPHWRESPTSREVTRGGTGGKAFPPSGRVCQSGLSRPPGAGCLAENSQSHGLAARSKAELNSGSFSSGVYF